MPLELVGSLRGRSIRHRLERSSVTIGRSAACELQLSDPSVSRTHAEIRFSNDRYFISDLGSRNGTWVNGKRADKPTEIKDGDRVEIASIALAVSQAASSVDTIISEEWPGGSSTEVSWNEIYSAGRAATPKERDLFTGLSEVVEMLSVERSLHDLFELILDLVERRVSAERIKLLLLEEGSPNPTITASRPRNATDAQRTLLSRTMIDRVLSERSSFVTTDALADERFREHESVILQGIRSAMAAPLFDNKQVIGLLYADSTDPGTRYTKDDLRTFTMLANLVAVKITQTRLAAAEEEKRRLEAELDTAKEILERILPSELKPIPGYDVCAHQQPCFTVGGDLYEACPMADGRVVLVLGDVAGKGLGAALLVSNIMSALRFLCDDPTDPARMVGRLHQQVWLSTDAVRYAGLFLGLLEPASGRLSYCNAGHNPPPLLIRSDGAAQELGSTGFPIGMFEDAKYEAREIRLLAGDFLALFSDGIQDAEVGPDQEYGVERLHELLRAERSRSPSEIVDVVRSDLESFLGDRPLIDDVTILLLKRTGG
jgi:serine phosphatase RsbU (regulator of sigma subunit)/pSer/pThr/pTyr-binding forkhead associated (FHA) protein